MERQAMATIINMLVQHERIRQKLVMYALKNDFNCNESGIHFQTAQTEPSHSWLFPDVDDKRLKSCIYRAVVWKEQKSFLSCLLKMFLCLTVLVDRQNSNLLITTALAKASDRPIIILWLDLPAD